MKLLNFFKRTLNSERPSSSYQFLEIGFHGDRYLLNIVDFLLEQKIEVFIETGTNVGTTLAFVAKTFPRIQCFSCEPDKRAFKLAKQNTSSYPNVHLFNQLSQEFIDDLKREHKDLFEKRTFFWLDAHSYGFDWPLKEEVRFVSENFKEAFLMIDDFKVPNKPMFGYDSYKEQLCAHEFIADSLGKRPYQLFYPAYTERTSTHHPLQGWGLYVLGSEIVIPESLSKYICKA